MAEQVSVNGFDPINYALGQGWYSQIPEFLNSINAGRGQRATTGLGLLGYLSNLLTSPTSGPLGLAATAAYGNPQAIATKTGGAGISNAPQKSLYDRLMESLGKYSNDVNATADNAPYTPAPVDPNKAPAMTPEQAAKAPNSGQDLINAWRAYHPGQPDPVPGYGFGGIVRQMLGEPAPEKMAGGGTVEPAPTPVTGTPTPSAPVKPYTMFDPERQVVDQSTDAPDRYAPYGGRELVSAMTDYVRKGGDANKFIKTVQAIGKLNSLVQEGKIPVSGLPPVPGQPMPDITHMGGDILHNLLAQYGSQVGFPGFRDGGVTLAGRPHFITDENGYPVAQITEDGAPENVRGLKNGGVEVTPLKPDRYAQYTGKPAGSEEWARMLARMEVEAAAPHPSGAAIPGAAVGQSFLFPDVPNSLVDTSEQPGTNLIPSSGGPTAPIDRGVSYGAGATPKSIDDLSSMIRNAPGANYMEQFARVMGGALANNTLMGDPGRALNSGKAPTQLLTSQQMASMSPTQRAEYTAMLQQMGIVGNPDDLAYWQKQFAPAGLG